ncbi:hypothetical protein BH23BAC4_BH23BAC4_15470 [soil metagenome]
MPADPLQVTALLDEIGLRYHPTELGDIILTFHTAKYRNPEGEDRLMVVIRLEEEGEYFKLFAPDAFKVGQDNVDAFLRACAIVQWHTKLIQFEFDDNDGEIRPIVEFPLEDAPLTLRQLQRCIHGLVALLEEYYPVLDQAARLGVVQFEERETMLAGVLGDLLSQVPPDVLGEALRRADERRRSRPDDDDGGGMEPDDFLGPHDLN